MTHRGRFLIVGSMAALALSAAPGSAAGYGAQDVYLTSVNAALHDGEPKVSPWQQSTIEPDSNLKSVNAALNS